MADYLSLESAVSENNDDNNESLLNEEPGDERASTEAAPLVQMSQQEGSSIQEDVEPVEDDPIEDGPIPEAHEEVKVEPNEPEAETEAEPEREPEPEAQVQEEPPQQVEYEVEEKNEPADEPANEPATEQDELITKADTMIEQKDQPFLSANVDPSTLTESKRLLLDEEDGQVIRFGNFEVSYKNPREIFCSTNVTLLSVDLKAQTFSVEMDMRFFWLQPEIEEAVPWEATWSIYDDGCSLPVDPDDLFEHDSGVDWIQQEFHYNRETKVVEWQCQFKDTFSERMELGRFPVDRQFLNILLQARVKKREGNWIWISQPPEWVPPKRWYLLRSRLGQSISDYELFAPWADFRVIRDDNNDDNHMIEQPPFKLRLRVQRYTSYYLGNINIPMFLIVAVCLVSLVMDPEQNELANRLSVTVTAMLAGVAFRFVVSEMLPPVNYLTWMDYYVGISFFMVSIFILENAIATIADEAEKGQGRVVDQILGGGLAAIWVLVNLFFFYACWSNTFRVSWEEMDLRDREPSELDDFQESEPDQTQGPVPDDPMGADIIQRAMMREITT